MTNEELSEAIAYAFQCCDQKYVGGYTTSVLPVRLTDGLGGWCRSAGAEF